MRCRILSDWTVTLLTRSQCLLRLNYYEMLWLYIDKSRIEYGKLWFASVYVENWNYGPRNKFHAIPVFRRDHLPSSSGILCSAGSFTVQFGDHFRSGDHLRSGIICGAVQVCRFVLQTTNRRAQRLWRQAGMVVIVDAHQLWHSLSGVVMKF